MADTRDPDLRRLEDAILSLPGRQRDIFLAHRVHGMSCGDIADRTGLTVRQVERHLARAICKLAKQMDGRQLNWWERRF